jgi:hypothetical protein
MNRKTIHLLLILALLAQIGVPEALAQPQYLTNITPTATVTKAPNATLTPTATVTKTPIATLTPTPIITRKPIPAATPKITTVKPTATPRVPGFELMVSIAGLLACFFLSKRRN